MSEKHEIDGDLLNSLQRMYRADDQENQDDAEYYAALVTAEANTRSAIAAERQAAALERIAERLVWSTTPIFNESGDHIGFAFRTVAESYERQAEILDKFEE